MAIASQHKTGILKLSPESLDIRHLHLSLSPIQHSPREYQEKLLDEDDSTPPSITGLSSHIEAQIHLLKVAVIRDRSAPHTRIQEQESSDKGSPVSSTQFAVR